MLSSRFSIYGLPSNYIGINAFGIANVFEYFHLDISYIFGLLPQLLCSFYQQPHSILQEVH